MPPGSTELASRARAIFHDLGYTVVGDGGQFRAEREWKVVRVTATDSVPDVASGEDLHCVVAPSDRVREIRRRLAGADLDCEWAIISVDGDGYDVERAPPGPATPA